MDAYITKQKRTGSISKGLNRPAKDGEGKEEGIDLLPPWRFLTREAEGEA